MSNDDFVTTDYDTDAEVRPKKHQRLLDDIGPVPDASDKVAEVHGWYIITKKPDDPFLDPSLGVGVLCAERIYNHKRLKDAQPVTTTPLLYLIGEGPGNAYAKSVNSWFRLFEPQQEYANFMKESNKTLWFPDGIVQNEGRVFFKEDGKIRAV